MTRTEALTQLNQKRKDDENRVWEEWFSTEGIKEVSSRIQIRTQKLDEIRDRYEKDTSKINQQFDSEEKEISATKSKETSSKEIGKKETQDGVEKKQPLDDVIRGTEDLLKSKGVRFNKEGSRKNVDGIQNPQNEPSIVRNAQEENRSTQIRESQQKAYLQNNQERGGYEGNQNIENTQASIIRDEFLSAGIDISSLTSQSQNDKELVVEVEENYATSSKDYPYGILFVAIFKDGVDVFTSFTTAIPIFGTIVWVFGSGLSLLCGVIIYIYFFFNASSWQKRFLREFIGKRAIVGIIAIIAESLPFLNLLPTTTLLVMFVATPRTKIGKSIEKAVEKIKELQL